MRKLLMVTATAAMMAFLPSPASAHGHGRGHWGIAHGNPHGCPPGLANRNPPCVPPGQVRRLFHQGQRLPVGYRSYTPYDRIPLDLRSRYGIPTGYNYIYRDNSVYLVDPRTRLVQSIIDLIGR